MNRRYKAPCPSCCGYDVTIVVVMALEPGKELVLGTCKSCERMRCRYERKRRETPR